MKKSVVLELYIRYLCFFVGLFILSIGVAFSRRGGLGTSPISCVPCVLEYVTPWTMGEITIVMHVLFIILQIVILRKAYDPVQLLQLPVAFIFGAFTDIANTFVDASFPFGNYAVSMLYTFIGVIFVGFGVYVEVHAGVVMLAGEGLSSAISKASHKEFTRVKITVDSSLVLSGVILSLIFLHGLAGVREGTILAAILVGSSVKLFERKLPLLNIFFERLK
jgi:uncharacterized protein